MYVATFPKKAAFGFANGSATVEATSTPKGIAEGKQDCVAAVVENLVSKQIIPTIAAHARP